MCPEPEAMARFAEGLADEAEREALVDHAADCASCRRHVAIAAMPPLPEPPKAEPVRPTRVLGALWSVAAAGLAAASIWYALTVNRPTTPTPRVGTPSDEDEPPTADQSDESPRRDFPPLPRKPKRTPPPPVPPRTKTPVDAPPPDPQPEVTPDPAPLPEAAPPPTPEPEPPPPPRETVAPDWKPLEPGERTRVALRHAFGSLTVREKGAVSSTPVAGARALPVDAIVAAGNRSGGATLPDGTRVQLATGASAAIFRSGGFKCPAVRVEQGTMLVDLPETVGALFVMRGESAVLVEGVSGTVLLNAGTRANVVEIAPLGRVSACRTGEAERVEATTSEVLIVEKGQVRRAARNGRAKEALAKFVAWPDRPETILAVTFDEREDGFARSERRDRRKGVHLALPQSVADGVYVLRVRFRTSAPRFVVGLGSLDDVGGDTVALAAGERSETEWTEKALSFTVSTSAAPFDARCIRFYVDVPVRADPDTFVFDIDEVELSRRK
jgi:hypothetical protein